MADIYIYIYVYIVYIGVRGFYISATVPSGTLGVWFNIRPGLSLRNIPLETPLREVDFQRKSLSLSLSLSRCFVLTIFIIIILIHFIRTLI